MSKIYFFHLYLQVAYYLKFSVWLTLIVHE